MAFQVKSRMIWILIIILIIIILVVLLSTRGLTAFVLVLISTLVIFAIICIIYSLRRKNIEDEEEEDMELPELDLPSGLPLRFTYKALKIATRNFQIKLGEGAFGPVFEGSLPNGEKIAVKQLNALGGSGKKEFMAEVKTIGQIYHVNLVRLIGFCAEKLHKLLVYESMCNGSLDKWIFYKQAQQPPLEWAIRKTIILNIANGLTYLHEGCRKRIFHLDIKPQNILLHTNLFAKISDFGLSKTIDRDQSRVMTATRGTTGYMAPEWFSSAITEKVDVYSFGIVVMEVICGRKNVDRSLPENCMPYLLPVFLKKAEEDRLIDLVDNRSEDMQLNKSEAAEILKLAVWCLQSNFNRRPSMSTVVKVLEGTMNVETNLEYTEW